MRRKWGVYDKQEIRGNKVIGTMNEVMEQKGHVWCVG